MIPSDFSELNRYTFDQWRRFHTDADCGGFGDSTYVYATPDDCLVISADETAIYAWGFRIDITYLDGYMEFHSMVNYKSPLDAFEVAREVMAIFEHGGDLPHDVYAEYV